MAATGDENKPGLHLAYLDSVRGIAAMIVVIYHYINWDYSDRTEVKIANIVFNGGDAVAFFFVLSGFVLSYKYLVLKHRLDYGKFCINRFFRLWPAFFITVTLNALYTVWKHNGPNIQAYLDMFVFDKYTFWKEALLVKPVAYTYYVPAWTLTIELVLSLFVPFLIIIAQNNRRNMLWLAGFFLLGAPGIVGGHGIFINHFVYGVLIATYFMLIAGDDFKQTRIYKYRYPIMLFGVLCFSMRPLEKLFTFPEWYDSIIFKYLGYEVSHLSGIGSGIILMFIIHSRKFQKMLEYTVFRFIGKISYGIYLMHWLLVLWISDHRWRLYEVFPDKRLAFVGLLVVCITATIVLATAIYYWVELPFIRLGKRLTSRMRPTLIIEPDVK